MILSHSPLVIGMVLFPDLTELDQTGSYAVFGRMPAANVHLLAEMLGPVRSELGFTITPDGIWASNPPLDVISRQRWGAACGDGTCAVARIPSGTEHIRDVSHGGLYWQPGWFRRGDIANHVVVDQVFAYSPSPQGRMPGVVIEQPLIADCCLSREEGLDIFMGDIFNWDIITQKSDELVEGVDVILYGMLTQMTCPNGEQISLHSLRKGDVG